MSCLRRTPSRRCRNRDRTSGTSRSPHHSPPRCSHRDKAHEPASRPWFEGQALVRRSHPHPAILLPDYDPRGPEVQHRQPPWMNSNVGAGPRGSDNSYSTPTSTSAYLIASLHLQNRRRGWRPLVRAGHAFGGPGEGGEGRCTPTSPTLSDISRRGIPRRHRGRGRISHYRTRCRCTRR